jgi:hypothetical protein
MANHIAKPKVILRKGMVKYTLSAKTQKPGSNQVPLRQRNKNG